jgi:holliday junction DNA helicase RuvB
MESPTGILSTKVESVEEEQVEQTLRPQILGDYVGQAKLKEHLQISLTAARQRQQALDHVLLYGPPGLGKTTLAHIIGREMSASVRVTSGPAIERAGDLASILTSLEPGDVLFIDEIHRLNRQVEEVLYPAMEDYCLDIVLGKGVGAKTVRLDLPQFTLVGATTRIGMLSGPFRDRFGLSHRLEFYNANDLEQIIIRAASVLGVSIDVAAAQELGRRSRGTPRIANRLLKRVRDVAEVDRKSIVDTEVVYRTLTMHEVDELGLDANDRRYLLAIVEKFDGGPVGIETMAASLAEDVGTLEEVVEPYLLQQGLIARTPRGRVITGNGYKHLKLQPKSGNSST